MKITQEAFNGASRVRLMIFDVDGVLTDGKIHIGADGESFKSFSCRDGLGIRLAQKAGFQTAIITGRKSSQTAYRAQELGITHLYQGCMDKREAYEELKKKLDLSDEEIAYVGDDLIDLPIMTQCCFPACVADAVAEVKESSLYIAEKNGGEGAVREIVEFIIKSQSKWEKIVDGFRSRTKDGTAEDLSQ